MTDQEIIDLYWSRQERAIEETDRKYGAYCTAIARNILRSPEDSQECVNDTWLQAWNTMPPQRPGILSAYLGTITRNRSLSWYRRTHAEKRRGDLLAQAYEELEDCVPDPGSLEDPAEGQALSQALNDFLLALPPRDACLLIRRYWYLDSTAQLARRYAMAESSVRSRLCRLRRRLRHYLEQEGVAP